MKPYYTAKNYAMRNSVGYLMRISSNRLLPQTDRRIVTLALTAQGRKLVEAQAPKIMDFWNGLLAGFTHAEIDTMIALLTRLVIASEAKTGKKLLISAAPIIKAKVKAKKAP
jgi:hypothetical protein